MKQKKIIGITGGVGAGKSSVLAVLRRLERHFSPRTEPWTEKRWRT